MSMQLMSAAAGAVVSGQMTQAQHDELAKVAAIDWRQILSLLPLIATFFPVLGPIIPLITPIITVIMNLINNMPVPGPTPVPTPGPVPPNVMPEPH